jgi:hypothetical protein
MLFMAATLGGRLGSGLRAGFFVAFFATGFLLVVFLVALMILSPFSAWRMNCFAVYCFLLVIQMNNYQLTMPL